MELIRKGEIHVDAMYPTDPGGDGCASYNNTCSGCNSSIYVPVNTCTPIQINL